MFAIDIALFKRKENDSFWLSTLKSITIISHSALWSSNNMSTFAVVYGQPVLMDTYKLIFLNVNCRDSSVDKVASIYFYIFS